MEQIAIIDFGGQYTHLIAKKVRKLGVYSDIYNMEEFYPENIENLVGIIFSGGPKSVIKKKEILQIMEKDERKMNFDIQNINYPILGICYGYQLIASIVGGVVEHDKRKEYGMTVINCDTNSILFNNLPCTQKVWMSHQDNVESMPDNYKIIATSDNSVISGYESKNDKVFGVQFHPEVTHTEMGLKILNNFVSLCTKNREWVPDNYEETAISYIKENGENKKLLLLVSGGVDSLVSLELCIRAVGKENIYPIHIDTGFMRKNESKEIEKHFKELGIPNIKIIDASYLFIKELENVVDPEEKRSITGKLFVEVLRKELINLNLENANWMLVQGTIYPDTIESGLTKKSNKIKTHHNRVKEIEQLIKEGKIIEPLQFLYKDEVRELSKNLGLPTHLIDRHPFPGPALAIRIIASDIYEEDDDYYKNGERIELKFDINNENAKLNNYLNESIFKGEILPIKSVGVQGDFRTYYHPAIIWNSTNNVNLDLNWDLLKKYSNKIINNFKIINRVIFSFYNLNKRLYLKKCSLNENNINLLREVDFIIYEKIKKIKNLWQMPVVSLPLFDANGKQAFVIRPVCSIDGMTADVYEMDLNLYEDINNAVLKKINEVGYLFYDITTKPPGTIEWE